jgi:hypothetical protein
MIYQSLSMGNSFRLVLQTALCTVQQRCERTNLSINPNKTVLTPFNRKRNIKILKEPILFSKTIQLPSEDKYPRTKIRQGTDTEKAAGQGYQQGL